MTEYNGVERTKTEPAKRLCELLDERDIKWHRSNGEHGMVIWERDGLTYSAANAWPRNDDTRTKLVLHVCYPTPEQAVAATVGDEIVRCKDCVHYREYEWALITDISDVCRFWADGVKVDPNGYCSNGERRVVDE